MLYFVTYQGLVKEKHHMDLKLTVTALVINALSVFTGSKFGRKSSRNANILSSLKKSYLMYT
jgi:hypothetical protein